MKICFLGCLDDLLLKDTGAPIRTYYLAKNLAKLGHVIHIVIPGDRETFEWTDKVIVHSISGLVPYWILRFFSRLVGVAKATSLFLYDLSFILRSRHIILNSDVIQIEGSVSSALITLFVNRIFRKPIIVDCHDAFQALSIKYQNPLRKILEIFLEKTTYKHAELILAVSEKEKDFLVRNGIPHDRIVVIPNGVDTEAFRPSMENTKVRARYDLKHSYTVVFVGNMEYSPNKEAADLITSNIAPRTLSQLDNVRFLIVGRIPPKLVADSSNVIFTGVVENVAEFLTTSDMAIAPLLHGSGTRLKILEYLSCGLPVVSTAIGVEGLEVENGVNILIEDNIDKFAVKIIDLLADRESRVRLSKAAREFVMEKYDWRIIAKQLDTIYWLISHNRGVWNKN